MGGLTDGVDIMYKFNSSAVLKNGKTYLNIKNYKIDFTATRFYMDLDNLFNGDKALSDNMNLFLNENWEELLKELKPRIAEVFGEIVTQIVNNVFARRPYKDHFLPSPGQT
jgi:Haemolymph juvenile hormone binding protein (JHBP)